MSLLPFLTPTLHIPKVLLNLTSQQPLVLRPHDRKLKYMSLSAVCWLQRMTLRNTLSTYPFYNRTQCAGQSLDILG